MYYRSYSKSIERPHRLAGKPTVFREPAGTRRRSARSTLVRYALPTVLIAWGVLLLSHPYFRIKNIEILGASNIKPAELRGAVVDILSQKKLGARPRYNYFLIPHELLQRALMEQFPLAAVNLTKRFPHTLLLDVQERLAYVIYDDGKNYILADEQGAPQRTLRSAGLHERKTIISAGAGENDQTATTTIHYPDSKALRLAYGNYPVVYNATGHPAGDGGTLLPAEIIAGVIEIQLFLERHLDFATHHYRFGGGSAIMVEDTAGMTVTFDTANNLNLQLDTFKTAWQREIRLHKGNPISVIARYPGRVYIEE